MSDELRNCVVCDTPIYGKSVCSSDCYHLNRFDLFNKHLTGDKYKLSALSPRKALHNAKRNCDNCGREFIARNSRTYLCSPQCKAIHPSYNGAT